MTDKPTRPPLPSIEELRERGFIVLPPSGKAYVIPVPLDRPKPPAQEVDAADPEPGLSSP
jgi:hypothetical protein